MSIIPFQIMKTKCYSGAGCISRLPEELRALGLKKPFIVTDKVIAGLPMFEKMTDYLEQAGLEYYAYTEVSPNVKDYEISNGREAYKKQHCDCVIGLGGGSSMDGAKGISALVMNPGEPYEYRCDNPDRQPFYLGRVPLTLIPTTSGTGSEVSPHCVVTNTTDHVKYNIMSADFYPNFVFFEPGFTLSLPAKITAETGVDALAHALEAYTSKKMVYGNLPFHESIALQAIRLVAENLRKACVCQAADVRARENMMWASMMGGFVLDVDVNIGHGLSGILQAQYPKMSHGVSVGVILPSCMEYNAFACPDQFRAIAEAFGEDTASVKDEEVGRLAADCVRKLYRDIHFPRLSDYMQDPAEIEEFFEAGFADHCNENNPRKLTLSDAKQIYMEAYQDTYEM